MNEHLEGGTQAATEIPAIVGFIREVDKLKGVLRKVKPLGLDRYENSAEHSWQLALLALTLRDYAAEPVRIDHVIRMLLVHDIGEIDTGDTMAFVEGGWAERKQDELAAVRRIFAMLPGEHTVELEALWQEFEHGDTPESRFANAVDRVMPALLNLANGGQSWKENGISYERVVRRLEAQISAGSPALWSYVRAELDRARELDLFGA
ncbi:HD domain-containing protein [Terriglobus aquaticus]|uniref:HD domain-containing protein n=1 Tax=Terriglobus aquaticus TaxID=940139 RepID=A0ABW9KPI5_9BACT|nr:HD domain-containing protein [Terriglobus aquaticus]